MNLHCGGKKKIIHIYNNNNNKRWGVLIAGSYWVDSLCFAIEGFSA